MTANYPSRNLEEYDVFYSSCTIVIILVSISLSKLFCENDVRKMARSPPLCSLVTGTILTAYCGVMYISIFFHVLFSWVLVQLPPLVQRNSVSVPCTVELIYFNWNWCHGQIYAYDSHPHTHYAPQPGPYKMTVDDKHGKNDNSLKKIIQNDFTKKLNTTGVVRSSGGSGRFLAFLRTK